MRHALKPEAAAPRREVRAFWAEVEQDTTARRELAGVVVDHLRGRATAEPAAGSGELRIRYAVATDGGLGPVLWILAVSEEPPGARAPACPGTEPIAELCATSRVRRSAVPGGPQ